MASSSKRFRKKGSFTCGCCNLSASIFGFGRVCPFSSGLVYLEDTYIGRDPFSPDPKPLILGSNCAVCHKPVCVSQSCSVFYCKRFCIECFNKNIGRFPKELIKNYRNCRLLENVNMAVKRRKKNKMKEEHNDPAQITNKSAIKRSFLYIAIIIPTIATIAYFIVSKNSFSNVPTSIITKQYPSNDLIQMAQRYSYMGQLAALRHLISQHDTLDWSNVQYSGPTSSTLVHMALQGRHDSLSSSSAPLSGHHEGILEYLVYELKWNASHGCPVYYALHYKNVKALELLLDASTDGESVKCLTTIDAVGLTAIHVAAKSKASGFARFYSRLFDKRGFISKPSEDVLSLLGLSQKIPFQEAGGTLTMESLNAVILHKDIELVLKLLNRSNIKLSHVLDQHNNTILHCAAYAGRTELVKMLLKFVVDTNDDVNFKNHFQQTPRHLAIAGGHTHIASLFQVSDDKQAHTRLQTEKLRGSVEMFQHEKWKNYLNSGWNIIEKSLKQHLNSSYPLCSQVLPIAQTYIASHHSPLLIYSEEVNKKQWNAWKHWRKNDFIERYGALEVEVSSIPYEDLYFDTSQRMTRLTLRDYVLSFDSPNARPLYLFDGKSLNRLPTLASDYVIPNWLDPSSIYLKQFILGGNNTGSPPHFHDHAVNVLIYGVKEWHFWKPSHAFFSFSHVMEWKNNHFLEPHMSCLQVPGDIIYVPSNWGHAVINKEDSIGIALEFW